MTVLAPERNGKRGGPPHLLTVPRAQIVGDFMDAMSLASEAMFASGAALQLLRRLPASTAAEQALIAANDSHDRITALRDGLRAASGRYDKPAAGAA